jgi:RpiB/LacA/LacB family sugar-phosphate isomerase
LKKMIVCSDHTGYHLKEAVKKFLAENDIEVTDGGTYSPEVSVDYPDFSLKAANSVALGENCSGIVICGTGIGVSIAANKVPGIRAALCFDAFTAHQARAHNDANILALGAWVVSPERSEGILQEWLNTPFEFGRHVSRVARLNQANLAQKMDSSSGQLICGQFKFGISISLHETVFAPLFFSGRLEDGLQAAADRGFELVEISIRDPRAIDADQLANLVSSYGLRVSALATGQSCLHEGLCLSAANSNNRARAVQRLQEVADLASHLDAAMIIGGVRGRFSQTPPAAQEYSWTLEAIRSCVRHAANREVLTLLEPINRYETNFINTIADGLSLLNEIGEPDFKLLADTFHMNIEEPDLLVSLCQAGDRLGYVHIADSNRRAPGQGHTDFRSVFQTLKQLGFQGPISAEMLPLPDDITALNQLHNFLSSLQ